MLRSRFSLFFLLLLLSAGGTAVLAQAFLPASDDYVVEHLSNTSKINKLKALLLKLKINPNDANLAEFTARQLIIIGHQDSDPRYYSYAESALAPWWSKANKSSVPKEILLLIANIKQFRHQFVDAIKDLNTLIKEHPDYIPALLMRSAVFMTQGEYQKALADCNKINANDLINRSACEAHAMSMGPNIELAYQKLKSTIKQNALLNKDQNLWSMSLLAEIAARLNYQDDASAFYQTSMEANPENSFLLASYADFLLQQRQYSKVVSLLKDKSQSDSLLLRLAIAKKNMKDPSSVQDSKELSSRFKEARLRNGGTSIHLREEAMFTLYLLGDEKRALDLAKENFAIQKEITDLRLLLEAAYMAQDQQSINVAKNFINKHGIKDIVIEELIKVNS